jgi:hypothetical protein
MNLGKKGVHAKKMDVIINNNNAASADIDATRKRIENALAKEERRACEFCGSDMGFTRRRFCSLTCRQRSSKNRATVRLAVPISKRARKRLMFSNPLYFN